MFLIYNFPLSLMRFIFVISSRWFYYSPISCCSECCFWRWLILAFNFQLLINNLILIIDIVVFIVRYLNRCFFRFDRSQSVSIYPIYIAILCLGNVTASFCIFLFDYSFLLFFVLINVSILLLTFRMLIVVEGFFWLLLNFFILYVVIIDWYFFQIFQINW